MWSFKSLQKLKTKKTGLKNIINKIKITDLHSNQIVNKTFVLSKN